MDERHSEVARRFRAGLEAIYGPRLKALYACAADEEEVEILQTVIILEGADPIEDIETTGELTSHLSLDTGVVIWRRFFDPVEGSRRLAAAYTRLTEVPAA